MKMSGMTTAITGALTTVQGDVLDMFGNVLPYALAIAGAFLTIRLGWKAFKSISGK